MRILFLSYNHVALAPGGAQQMADEMLSAARAAGHEARLVAALEASDVGRFDAGYGRLFTVAGRKDEVYFRARGYDADLIAIADPQALSALRGLIGKFRPDVVHFHHYLRFGVEALAAARLAAPEATITLTFHEMAAICAANGQMVKTRSRDICSAASPDACAECRPERSGRFFELRAERLKAAFDVCDAFVFPSQYLAGVYLAWGLDPDRSAVIANGVAHPAPEFDRSSRSAVVNRFAFFGQMIDNKGLAVALEALVRLARRQRIPAAGLEFQIHAANREYASPAYRQNVEVLTAEVERVSQGRIRVVDKGAYSRAELAERMAGVDWVVAPSTWGENYPLVLSEAWMFGRPVIVTAIGGLAERVRDGVDGVTFPLRDADALAQRIAALAGDVAAWERLSAGIEAPPTPAEMFSGYERLWADFTH